MTDLVSEMRLLRARLEDRVETSRRLMAGVGGQDRLQRQRAHVARKQTEASIDGILDAWPRVYGLTSPDEARTHGDVLPIVVDAAQVLFGRRLAVSVMTVDQLDGSRRAGRTVVATGSAEAMEQAQHQLGEGPGLDALQLDMVTGVRADDFTAAPETTAWPRLSRAAAALGVRSALCIALPWSALRNGLHAEHRAVGAINLYATEAHAFDRPEAREVLFGCWAGATLSGRDPVQVYRS